MGGKGEREKRQRGQEPERNGKEEKNSQIRRKEYK